ncbi:phage baseplate plug protein [Pseudomonas fluorescens]|uniref:Cyanophage baseplate Pam3 plug gp18 domain-containing protein n=3 Tax=Pseudomonas fluorescens TaxID=294 RepID=A0ABY1TEC0_PSEFL|nr:hypothetical protein SAMN04488487_3826 [Pseudomonas fluorescens]SQF90319.1 Uncharacterised protein [Pseudomonas fluorescens]
MSRYSVSMQALPAQTLVARLGKNSLTIELQWMVRMSVFRVNILTSLGLTLTSGRYLLPNVDLLAGLYPRPSIKYGSLFLEGDLATPENLGVDNLLVWTDE